MLTGNLLRVKYYKSAVRPQWLDARDPQWLAAAEDLRSLYRDAVQKTRSEVQSDVNELIADSPTVLVLQGLAKLLDDRCEYETVAEKPPDEVREVAFRASAIHRAAMTASSGTFSRDEVIRAVSDELTLTPHEVETLLFADLKDEQRIHSFEDITPEQLLDRYNVALAQSVLLKSVGVEVKVWGDSPARYRQLFRAIRFRRLIATIREAPGNAFHIRIDGPLSLFSATQKYGLQLALFLPALLHCKAFELRAELRWGTERKEKVFELCAADDLRSHTADFGTYRPKEFELFADSFRSTVSDWTLADEPLPVTLPDGVWVPDFALTHMPSGTIVYLELFGYWRAVDLAKHVARLEQHLPGRFLVAASQQYRTDDESDSVPASVVHYRRTPSAEQIAKAALAQIRNAE